MMDIARNPDPEKRKILFGVRSLVPRKTFKWMEFRSHKRKLFGRYGFKSNIPPEILWPRSDELKQLNEYYHDWEINLRDSIQVMKERKTEADEEYSKQKKAVAKAMKEMPKLIKNHEQKIAEFRKTRDDMEAKKRADFEEAKLKFGRHLTPESEEYLEMQTKKAEEEKAVRRKEKKAAKLRELMGVLNVTPPGEKAEGEENS